MRLFKKKKLISSSVFGVLLFVVCFMFFVIVISNVSDEVDDNEINVLKTSIDNAIIACYAIEGTYPEDLQYIEDNYGVIIDHDKFIVIYELLGPNVKPNVLVAPVQEE
ncbi:MAG: hypothetical protein IJP13_05180 [Lachnospiraceae bacterium]|nr:hypothetical protein [Lachnospiraceae bacterium]